MSHLVELNGFYLGTNGVYGVEQESREFNYSDGEQTEVQLHKILSTANDLSSGSSELQASITDWPSEYHLSETRSNLLRSFNFEGVTRVLELGCGCGSITRFLGEQDGLQVDSIEGSPTRAGLAALRCKDLDNVTIATANFNDVVLPEAYYDLVLFVGVTEYAGRFSNRETDQEALQDLLALARRSTTDKGTTLVAIENRLGLKYLLGANEDHYAVPFVGLDDYPESTGIRTYSRTEWLDQATQAGFSQALFYFPFPDYKVPTVLIPEDASSQDVLNALDSVNSRDYSRNFHLSDHENRAWQGLAEAGNLADHANSFLILLSDDADQLTKFANTGKAKLEVYPIQRLDYLEPVKVEPKPNPQQERIQRLQKNIQHVQSHAQSLEQKIELMQGSLGWRMLSAIRRLLGKKNF